MTDILSALLVAAACAAGIAVFVHCLLEVFEVDQ